MRFSLVFEISNNNKNNQQLAAVLSGLGGVLGSLIGSKLGDIGSKPFPTSDPFSSEEKSTTPDDNDPDESVHSDPSTLHVVDEDEKHD